MIVTGKVYDDFGGLPGVTVTQSGTTKHVITDFDGNYTIDVPQGSNLIFTYIGFQTVSKNVSGHQSRIDVLMEEDTYMIGGVEVNIIRDKKKNNVLPWILGGLGVVSLIALASQPASPKKVTL